jgi:hypothetical protein
MRLASTLASSLVLLALLALLAGTASAEVLQAPIGGRPIALGDARVVCGAPTGGWSVEAGGHALRPPVASAAVGQEVELKVAPTAADCAKSTTELTLVATDRWPAFDLSSSVFSPDDGRLDASGRRFRGVGISWKSEGARGLDVCRDPQSDGGVDHCTWSVARDAAADLKVTTFAWLPSGARAGPDVATYDAEGHLAKDSVFALVPARVTIARLLLPDPSVDLGTGEGEIPLVHPEAVASADCGALTCEMSNGQLVVRGAAALVSSLEVKLRFRPHVYLLKKDALEAQATVRLSVLHCPMSIVSGPPVRGDDAAKVIVKLEERCGRDLGSVRFVTDHSPLKVLQIVDDQDATYVLLRLGEVSDDSVTITALRGQPEGIALAVARSPTRTLPTVRASLELPGFPNLNFIPNNRAAAVHVSPAGEHLHFALLPVEGVYEVSAAAGGGMAIRGDPNAAGLTQLTFGLRADGLPDGLEQTDLAVVSDPLQRSIHEANIPAPIGASVLGPKPLIELVCGGGPVRVERVIPGATAHLPFSLRDTCRVVFHRERLAAEYGTQKLQFEIEVQRSDGSARGDAHVSEIMTFRAGSEPRYAWIHGIVEPFDRMVVRVSHEADEAHYVGASEIQTGAPAAQWSAVLGTGSARLYGTTTIPTGLYRLSTPDYSGVLSLNFGVISRLTWLDSEGHEGFLGLEGGIVVIGLANSTSLQGNHSLTQVGGVFGLGASVPIANRGSVTQASINLHAWLEADITRNSTASKAGRYAVIFGPSISIGNVGLNL